MRRLGLILAALILGAGTATTATGCATAVIPTPTTWTVSYAGAMYCGYIYDPREIDMFGQALTCQRVMFPGPTSSVVAGTLAFALLDYLETYDSFYHSGYYYDTYYRPLGTRYHITLIQRTTFLSNSRSFETRYRSQISTQSAKARWTGGKTGNYRFPTSNSKARNRSLTNSGSGATNYGSSNYTGTRDSRIPTTSRRTSTSGRSGGFTGKSGTTGRRR